MFLTLPSVATIIFRVDGKNPYPVVRKLLSKGLYCRKLETNETTHLAMRTGKIEYFTATTVDRREQHLCAKAQWTLRDSEVHAFTDGSSSRTAHGVKSHTSTVQHIHERNNAVQKVKTKVSASALFTG